MVHRPQEKTHSAMTLKLLKTKFYPVDIANRLIIDEPFGRERDLARKYRHRNPGVIGTVGAHLMTHPLYGSFRVVSAESEANRLLQGRYDAAHARAYALCTPRGSDRSRGLRERAIEHR